jgi:hypothetical protein
MKYFAFTPLTGTVPFKLAISPVFNFHSGQFIADDLPIENEHWTASGMRTISNVQYDPVGIFIGGKSQKNGCAPPSSLDIFLF